MPPIWVPGSPVAAKQIVTVGQETASASAISALDEWRVQVTPPSSDVRTRLSNSASALDPGSASGPTATQISAVGQSIASPTPEIG